MYSNLLSISSVWRIFFFYVFNFNKVKKWLGHKESTNNYQEENSSGFIGKYQFGYSALIDIGFVKKSARNNDDLNDNKHWNIVGGKQGFLNNPTLQEQAMDMWLEKLYGYLNPDEDEGYVFNYLLPDLRHNEGIVTENIDDSEFLPDHIDNQYRVLNQVQKIYDKFNDEPLNPYSSLKIRFKMKTTHVLPPANSFDDGEDAMDFQDNPLNNYAPKVEIGILQSQFEETPKAGTFSIPSNLSILGLFNTTAWSKFSELRKIF